MTSIDRFTKDLRKKLKGKNKLELKHEILRLSLIITKTKKRSSGEGKIKQQVLIRDGFRCRLCGEDVHNGSEIHHLTQISNGGDNTKNNLITLCPHCHAFMHCNPKLSIGHRQSVREGIERARLNGKTIGRPKGSKDKKIRSKKGYYKKIEFPEEKS